jgi:hypothetical protein
MSTQLSAQDRTAYVLTSVALATVFLMGSGLPARAQRSVALPTPPPNRQAATASLPSPSRMSIEIDTGNDKFVLKPIGGAVYDVYREGDNQKIGSANVATGDLMPLGPDFEGNNAALQTAKTAYLQGKAHPYNPGNAAVAISNNNSAMPVSSTATASSQPTFTAAGAAMVSVPNDRTLGGPARITVSPDARVYTAEVLNGDKVVRRITATYKEEKGASKTASRFGRGLVYAASGGFKGSVQEVRDSFEMETMDSNGATSKTRVEVPGAGNSKLASRQEQANDVFDSLNGRIMLIFYRAKEAALVAKAQNASGSAPFNPDSKAVSLIDQFGANDRQLNGVSASSK